MTIRIERVRPRQLLLALLLALVAVGLPAQPAEAYPDPDRIGGFPVAPGVSREVYRWNVSGGQVIFQVLRMRRDDPNVSLVPELADGHAPGREATHHTLRRKGRRAVAGVNANFFFPSPGPYGEPEGLFLRHRDYVSEPETKGRGPRGAFALFPRGGYDVALPGFSGRIRQPDGVGVVINGLNQHPAQPTSEHPDREEVTVMTPLFGNSTLVPSETTEIVLRKVKLRMTMEESHRVVGVTTTGNTRIPDDGVVIAASGGIGRRWARGIQPGDEVGLALFSDVGEQWSSAEHAVGAGPLIVRDRQVTPESSWNTEGFGPYHNRTRHPRTVIAFRGAETLLVTIDGRQPSRSVGLTTQETAHLMQHLGAQDAVMLDGGGSTTMAVDGGIVNRPCCDRAGFREVASSLVVYANAPTPDVTRLHGDNRWAVGRTVAHAGWPQGSGVAVLASGEDFPDALAGGPLAARYAAPLLLTGKSSLPWSTARALDELDVRHVMILGGPGAVGDGVLKDLRSRGYTVERVRGKERTQTAAAIALRRGAPTRRVLLASAENHPDALSAAVPADAADAPLLTTWTDRLSGHTAYALRRLRIREVVVVGGPNAVSDDVLSELRRRGYSVRRVAGSNRFATSAAIVNWAKANAGLRTNRIILATGADFPHALIAGPFGAKRGAPVVLTEPLDIDRAPATRRWLDQQSPTGGFVVGARYDLSTWVAYQLQRAIAR